MDSGNHNRTPSLAMLIQDFGQRSGHDLADEFGVSHGTVRHATAILSERGLIASIHGRGTYVASCWPGRTVLKRIRIGAAIRSLLDWHVRLMIRRRV